MNFLKIISVTLTITIAISCSNKTSVNDAYGNFEAVEILISSQGNGEIMQLSLNEGDKLTEGQQIGYIDTIQLYLQKQQLIESIEAIKAKLPNINTQVDVLKEKLSKIKFEKNRVKRLVESEAANTKQLDDINSEIAITKKQIIATTSSLTTQKEGILAEVAPVVARINIIDDLIKKSIINSAINGTILTKYANKGELTVQGRPLFKIANIDTLICRAYITQTQLSDIKLGQKVTVFVDSKNEGSKQYSGKISWIASKAEFTPKVIQTKDERANLVYAIKIRVANDGYLKIGMPAEVKF